RNGDRQRTGVPRGRGQGRGVLLEFPTRYGPCLGPRVQPLREIRDLPGSGLAGVVEPRADPRSPPHADLGHAEIGERSEVFGDTRSKVRPARLASPGTFPAHASLPLSRPSRADRGSASDPATLFATRICDTPKACEITRSR